MNAPEPRYDTALPLSGSRFTAVYRIAAESPAAAEEAARALVVEQTIEFPAELVGGDDRARGGRPRRESGRNRTRRLHHRAFLRY